MKTAAEYDRSVFINCPFDDQYRPLFEAVVFCVFDCGFRARCAMEVDDSAQVRVAKIFDVIAECRFGLHDLSRAELDRHTGLPRFNMPFELGVFLGARRFGDKRQRTKGCLVLDREQYRYHKFLSDIAGQDIRSHGDDARRAVVAVRNWLQAAIRPRVLPSGGENLQAISQIPRATPGGVRRIGTPAGRVDFRRSHERHLDLASGAAIARERRRRRGLKQ